MSPELTEKSKIIDLIASRFASDGKKIVYATQLNFNTQDNGLNHQQLVEKYGLQEGHEGDKPCVRAAGWIEPVGGGKVRFVNDTTSCKILGTPTEQNEILKKVHELAIQILGPKKVADFP